MDNSSSKVAAFFDVDGTLVPSTIVHYYAYFRRQGMPPWTRRMWTSAFVCKCLLYLLLDQINRGRFNQLFYRNYKGMAAQPIRDLAGACHDEVIAPRLFPPAVMRVKDHLAQGHVVALVTGSIDFVMAPLASCLGLSHVMATRLCEQNGRFTGHIDGDVLDGIGKAKQMRAFAQAHNLDLSRSHAYTDSMSDLPMLEAVGVGHVVNANRRLRRVARQRKWETLRWE